MYKVKFTDLSIYEGEGQFIASNGWTCEIEGESIPLALHVEVIDMLGATGQDEFKNYPFIFSIGIIAKHPHESFREEGSEGIKGLICDAVGYMGSVPVDHIFLSTDKLNKNFMMNLKAKTASIITVKSDYGTIAAQEGKNTEFSYPQFKTALDANKFAKKLIKQYSNSIMTLVGFTLDKPINMVGETGWDMIEKMVKGI